MIISYIMQFIKATDTWWFSLNPRRFYKNHCYNCYKFIIFSRKESFFLHDTFLITIMQREVNLSLSIKYIVKHKVCHWLFLIAKEVVLIIRKMTKRTSLQYHGISLKTSMYGFNYLAWTLIIQWMFHAIYHFSCLTT